jgi:uncharacterized membrane protein YhaH (DUF805 family)
MLKSIFGGRLSRIGYACVAIPLVLLLEAAPFILRQATPFFRQVFNVSLADMGLYIIVLSLCIYILPLFTLIVVSIKRLHDMALTGWLALPLSFKLGVGFAIGMVQGQAILNETAVDETTQLVLTWLSRGVYIYGLVLVLALVLVPGRRQPSAPAAPSAVF